MNKNKVIIGLTIANGVVGAVALAALAISKKYDKIMAKYGDIELEDVTLDDTETCCDPIAGQFFKSDKSSKIKVDEPVIEEFTYVNGAKVSITTKYGIDPRTKIRLGKLDADGKLPQRITSVLASNGYHVIGLVFERPVDVK